MAIQKEIWLNDIVENLFPDNAFYRQATDDSPFVLNGKTVHLPQSGNKPTVAKNRASLPAAIGQRTDTDVTYNLDEYTTDPILVKDSEEMEVSYTKRQSILEEHVRALNTTVGDHIAHAWSASGSANIVRTTGASVAAAAPGATGNRQKVVLDDIIKLAEKMDEQGFPREERYLLLPTNMYYQLFEISELISWDKMGQNALPQGMMRKLLDFNVMARPSVLVYDNAATPAVKAVGASGGIDDNLAALAWHKSAVCFAQGETELYINEGVAEYYGDVFSAMVRAGGRQRRSDAQGVLALVQDHV